MMPLACCWASPRLAEVTAGDMGLWGCVPAAPGYLVHKLNPPPECWVYLGNWGSESKAELGDQERISSPVLGKAAALG